MDEPASLLLRFDQFELDEGNARLSRAGQAIPLPPKAFSVLCALARRPGQLVQKGALLDAVWGHQHISESVLKTTISELRAALSDDARQPRFIETVSRRGYRFIGEPSSPPAQTPAPDPGAPPLAAPVSPVPGAPIIGRREMLDRLRAAWNEAGSGRRQIVLIAGEAGVGKTTLIDGFIAGLGDIVCAHGQCVEHYGTGEPYLPVLEALGALTRRAPDLVPMMRAVAPTWLLQMPWLCSEAERETLRLELAGANPDRMLRELAELLDRFTRQRPLLLVTEDLHWSDQATVRLLDYLARRRGAARLMWIGTFRIADVVAGDHPLKTLRHELRLHRLCDELLLDAFSEQEVADYVGSRFPDAGFSEDFIRGLHARTDGLPLFLVNVIDDLASRGVIGAGRVHALPEAAGGEWQVPENLAGAIEQHIARLPTEAQALLEAAAVCGMEFRPRTLADAIGRDASGVVEQCDELARRGNWIRHVAVDALPDGSIGARFAFRHAIYHGVLYQRTGALKRAQLHRAVALSMERALAAGVPVSPAELASHFERGHEPAEALRHYVLAAESALRHFAPTEALELTSRAQALLPHCPEGAERIELEMALLTPRCIAASQLRGVTGPETVAAFERVHELYNQHPVKSTRALEMGLGWVYHVRGEYDRARALAARIDAIAQTRGDRLLHVSACLLTAATQSFQGELEGARRSFETGLEAFAEFAERLTLMPFVVDLGVSICARYAYVLAHLGLPDQARAQSDAALARARRTGQPYAQMIALVFAGVVEIRLVRPQQVLDIAEVLRKIVETHGLVEGEGPWRWLQGWAMAMQGQPAAGHELLVEGHALHFRHGRIGGGTGILGYGIETLILAGRWDEARAEAARIRALVDRIGERIGLPDLLLLQAKIALAAGEAEAARRLMREALDEARAQHALWLELLALADLCELEDAPPEDFAALREARGRLREGLDLGLVARVGRILDSRAPAPEAGG